MSPTLLRLNAQGNPIAAGNLALRDAFFSPRRIVVQRSDTSSPVFYPGYLGNLAHFARIVAGKHKCFAIEMTRHGEVPLLVGGFVLQGGELFDAQTGKAH